MAMTRNPNKSTRDELEQKERAIKLAEAGLRRLEREAAELRAIIAQGEW